MEIKFNPKAPNVGPADGAPGAKKVAAAPVDKAVFETPALQEAVRVLSDIRPEAIERAQRYIGDPTYPPRETIRKIAHLLAMELSRRPPVPIDPL